MHVEGHPIEILAIDKAVRTDPGRQGEPVALFTFRPQPERCVDTWVLLITPEQCLRIVDTMREFLDDPESWLHLTRKQQEELRSKCL
jgi:hypothetical protein